MRHARCKTNSVPAANTTIHQRRKVVGIILEPIKDVCLGLEAPHGMDSCLVATFRSELCGVVWVELPISKYAHRLHMKSFGQWRREQGRERNRWPLLLCKSRNDSSKTSSDQLISPPCVPWLPPVTMLTEHPEFGLVSECSNRSPQPSCQTLISYLFIPSVTKAQCSSLCHCIPSLAQRRCTTKQTQQSTSAWF